MKRSILFLVLLCLLSFIALTLPNTSKKEGDAFISKALVTLDGTGKKDGIKEYSDKQKPVSEIYPGNWEKVCVLPSNSIGGGVTELHLRETFNISSRIELDFPYGKVVPSDWNWVLIFYTSPNKIEMLSMEKSTAFGDVLRGRDDKEYPPCIKKEEAYIRKIVQATHEHKGQVTLAFLSIKKWKESIKNLKTDENNHIQNTHE